MVYMDNPNEFSPVSESAYCGAGNVHTILLHTSPSSKVLSVFSAVPSDWKDVGFHQLRAVRKRLFFRHCLLKPEYLPRQARDKHSKS